MIDRQPYFIADIGSNHDGSLNRARDLIRLAAKSGAHAAKFQNFRAETIVSERGFDEVGKVSHQVSWDDGVVKTYRKAETPIEWTEELAYECECNGIDYLTSLYDLDMFDRLRNYVSAWKVGSGDITWSGLLAKLSEDDKPIFLGTGASTMGEVNHAVNVIRALRTYRQPPEIILMQCNSNYTGDRENFNHINLNVLEDYHDEYPDLVLGLSDHTPGHTTVLGAFMLGARVFEKHFTDDRTRPGPDHSFAMDPAEWRTMVDATRDLEAALGDGVKRVMDNELETVVVQRRAIRTAHAIDAGAMLAREDLVALRPCPVGGLPPYLMLNTVGRKTTRDLEAGEMITYEDLC